MTTETTRAPLQNRDLHMTASPAFLTRLAEEPYALLFAGQATPWRDALAEAGADASLAAPLARAVDASDALLSPVRLDLAGLSAAALPFSFAAPGAESPQGAGNEGGAAPRARVSSARENAPELSVPGIVLAQYASVLALALDGLDTRTVEPVAVEGHSQGVLGAEMWRAWAGGEPGAVDRVVALARLIGAAAARTTRRSGLHPSGEATAMLSVRRFPESLLARILEGDLGLAHPVSVGVRNDRRTHVLSGDPADLALVASAIGRAADRDRAEHTAHRRGGAPLSPVSEFLPVLAPFHSGLLEDAVAQTLSWAASCGLDREWAEPLARRVLTDRVDWPSQISDAVVASGARWLLECGPGTTLTRLTRPLVEGAGVGIVPAGTAEDRDHLSTPGWEPPAPSDWSGFQPRLATLPDGTTVVDTAFSRLTGCSPVLLAGMTPTTVDPEIVAAAANTGYWTELAGGGQVTEEVYSHNLTRLRELLEPGRTAKFNAMFLDRYLWNLQFGAQRIVSRSRAQGAPLDGVVVSAGIPELDEALDLITQLRSDGFPYVAFKPGTVDQILSTVQIARAVPDVPVIIHIEDGHAGGHHSWEDLDDLLLQTYATLRATPNMVVCVGGGIGTPERAADYLSGQWSLRHARPLMPVDGVLVGTAAMTVKEARTTPEVKALLVATPGVGVLDEQGGWIAVGESRGGMTSGLSHLRADMHEVDNSAASAARLIAEIGGDGAAVRARREEVVAALDRTAKPYFGDLATMTYAQWVRRFADLSFPWADPTFADRFHRLLQRVEARLSPLDHGDVPTLFPDVEDARDAPRAVERLLAAYPLAETTEVTAIDTAWFPTLCRSFPKPMPFVPVLDDDLLRWWGQDGLWQSQDPRYPADSVRIIPGPVSVAGIDRVDEPVASLLGRFEQAGVRRLEEADAPVLAAWSRLGAGTPSSTREAYLRAVPHIMWTGHLIANPAHILPGERVDVLDHPGEDGTPGADLVLHLDTAWDDDPEGASKHAVRELVVPLSLPDATARGGVPVVDESRLPAHMDALLAGIAGVGSTSTAGDRIGALPQMAPSGDSPFGEARTRFTLAPALGPDHAAVTADALPDGFAPAGWVPDALLGPCWPAIYAALGSAVHDGYPVIEGLLNAVHLDHMIELPETPEQLLARGVTSIDVVSHVAAVEESSSGRIVTVALRLTAEGQAIGSTRERFAIRGRASGDTPPVEAPVAGGAPRAVRDTPRSVLRRVTVRAPHDMTPFAIVSGDFNPIHTSSTAARVAGMDAPLVHGMWLSAVAQHAVCASVSGSRREVLRGWTYEMYGPVDLDATVEIVVERTGRVVGGGLALEVTCRIGREIVSRATATTLAPATAYLYPGQGIQARGMGLDERAKSPAVDEIWTRADRHTREALGFSILAIVRDNPTQITARGVTYRHPDGVLNLTQFTQVALATLAFAQTARLRDEGALVEGACFAGHSLGEYDALSAYAQVFPLETVLELVFHRGSTMHHLVERDAEGRSNYRMGVLRPNQFGVDDAHVVDYVAGVARRCGEFLEIVNFNLAGQQYAIAGTLAGLDALAEDSRRRSADAGGRNPFMFVPGIDVPFHSSVLRRGVPEFRRKLEERIPRDIDADTLIGRYIPNLVARPFELTREFAASILEVVPSEALAPLVASEQAWATAAEDRPGLARLLLVELLSWQFASPVRWIETQDALLRSPRDGGLGVEEVVEIGLGASPTLANLADRTLRQPVYAGRSVAVRNVQRDAAAVLRTDVAVAEAPEADEGDAPVPVEAAPTPPAAPSAPMPPAPEPIPAGGPADGPSGADVPDLRFGASDAIRALLALAARVRPEEVGDHDTTESLTNGVSSRRNQLLMDLSAELGLSSIDGAAEADVTTLCATVDRLAHNYQPFGPVLTDAIRERIRRLFGSAGVRTSHIAERVAGVWQLGGGWAAHATIALLLGTREGASTREGDLATLGAEAPADASGVDALIDAAVREAAARHGVSVSLPSAPGSGGGGVVDSAALDALADSVTGPDGILASTARHVLAQLGLDVPAEPADGEGSPAAVLDAVSAELGQGWPDLVAPRFDTRRAVLLDDRWASAREDLARLAAGEELPGTAVFTGAGRAVADQASWHARRAEAAGDPELAARFRSLAAEAARTPDAADPAARFARDVAVVTGMAPSSIAGAVVAGLLAGGATVVATASAVDAARLQFAKELYRSHAAPGAKLWLVPANLASYRDVDALVDWVGHSQSKSVGGTAQEVKPALLPTLFFPFAAPRVSGTLGDAGPRSENQMRLLLWSVERTLTGLAAIGADTVVDHRLHVVLPGSPNRGMFGGDGAYSEAKSSFDAIASRWHSEHDWSDRVSIAHPRIGWVRGTGLMSANDPLVDAVERAGVRTWSTEEMAGRLLDLCAPEVRGRAALSPVDADLTGGLGADIDLGALRAEAAHAAGASPAGTASPSSPAVVSALPSPTQVRVPHVDPDAWGPVGATLEDTVVVVGIGEVGPWGSARTRLEAELGIRSDGTVDLTPAGVLELAWMTGLLTWRDSPVGGWYDADDQMVPESEIFERYRDEVVARSGVRTFADDGPLHAGHTPEDAAVFLNRDISFAVADEAEARSYLEADPRFTRISHEEAGGEWTVTRLAGGRARVPRRATLSRRIGGQFPTGFDPAKWGIPASMIDSIDRIAVWNLVTAVDAFISSGFSPAELLSIVHPADVADTQGTGFGGMTSMRKLFVDRFLGEGYPQDILQETLPNVVAAHVMQSYIGGYGAMVNPVGACATAAVSIEEGLDKIACRKADVVVAGAIDDIQVESIEGFGSMNATADSQAMLDQGIPERFVSRANDRRRGGFVESQGGGTVLLARASVAARMGLPVLGVLAYARSFADGAHTSIPAPGLGALAAGRGGAGSPLARSLRDLGLSPDDVAVVSKHDTSTNANDPNESDLHTRLARALGRTPGNPLLVISQKSLTGHAKGGACVFQVSGLTQLFRTGTVPANASLDCVDEEMARYPDLVWLRRPLDVSAAGPVRAAFATSLGFGHVSSLVALVHPAAFEAVLAASADTPDEGLRLLAEWRERSDARLRAGTRRRESGMLGHEALFEPIKSRRLPEPGAETGMGGASGVDPHEVEAAMLLDPQARLGSDGVYHRPGGSQR
jgi:fatty acid synthase